MTDTEQLGLIADWLKTTLPILRQLYDRTEAAVQALGMPGPLPAGPVVTFTLDGATGPIERPAGAVVRMQAKATGATIIILARDGAEWTYPGEFDLNHDTAGAPPGEQRTWTVVAVDRDGLRSLPVTRTLIIAGGAGPTPTRLTMRITPNPAEVGKPVQFEAVQGTLL